MQLDPFARAVIAFHSRKRNRVKLLLYERRAFTAIESDDDDFEAQISTIVSYPHIFGRPYWNWTVVRGASIGPVLWSDALASFVRETRERSGALRNEPLPVYAENSLAAFLRDAEGLS